MSAYTFKFSTGESTTIEVSEEWVTLLKDEDRREYNNQQAQTRRHCSLEAYNLDDALLPSDENVEASVLQSLNHQQLYSAIAKLQPQQKRLLERVYFKGEKLADISREDGVSKAALTNRMKKIYAALQKNLA